MLILTSLLTFQCWHQHSFSGLCHMLLLVLSLLQLPFNSDMNMVFGMLRKGEKIIQSLYLGFERTFWKIIFVSEIKNGRIMFILRRSTIKRFVFICIKRLVNLFIQVLLFGQLHLSRIVYIYIYIYLYIFIELPWLENLANTYMRHTEHWTAVSTLLGLISSAYHDLHHWRSNQQPQNAIAETLPLGHRSISHISDAKLTSLGEMRYHLT